jgi:hypothetical protein
MQLRWIASTRASWAHAAAAIANGVTLVDPQLEERLSPGVAMTQKWLGEQGVPATFWEHLPALAAGIVRNDELATVVLTKTVGRDRAASLTTWLAAILREIELLWLQQFPELTDELALRAQPLREQWEGRGAGILKLLTHLTEPGLLTEAAEIVLVQPVLGGGGRAQLANNSVRIEAVLANPLPALPEFVRLSWLLAQLNLDLPAYRELVATAALPAELSADQLCALAVLPPILAAAEDLEIVPAGPETFLTALQAWMRPQVQAADAETLNAWWDTYRASKPPFAIALRALADMLGERTG